MNVSFDKHRHILSPALAPTPRRGADEFERQQKAADATLTIGLINNMPDPALQATERQFTHLLQAAAGNRRIHLHCFSLPSVKRSPQAKALMEGRYADVADLARLQLDGLIVTGAEPIAATLPEEPFWKDLTDVIDWAEANTRSAIWSCLAAHAVVLHLDGIERRRLDVKCSGVYDCDRVNDSWLMKDIHSPLKIAHSRINALRNADLTAHGYQLLTESRDAGVDIFAKRLRSHFVFFQGHPEYDALSLQREYLRDITRYLARQRDIFPAFPKSYFNAETEHKLANYQKRASAERQIPLSVELPHLALRSDLATGVAAAAIFRNWLDYLSGGVQIPARTT
ncbi:MAG: homoserine O-succinyltransferase [Bradyrhizobium sp.]|uniref:homoserine O-succinyltransferase MetA n=1 Tax=Bradyrhizobium sp. TaxID=376 RepID=UPI001C2A41CA|nr:homoserine O-succinyltransferase [Bradyrhizobium sp.]MBU6463575.1 homoserine O-succinyltransferase [Pseudomonadota bacterium]MDE2067039.1 homoserine O-succinyltransferase [Bradyrhizobium sp.]MDE2241231.1 homoserine O-succinyltransferase [Bradyrhizobium sp.]MDE2468081.1 homoserine O-succinyltransferase [Bradyrhizobium sp.]